jgi:hypothetical protein
MLYVCGFVVLGVSFQNKLSLGAVIMGWGIAVASIMINTVAVCGCLSRCAPVAISLNYHVPDAYCTDCFPKNPVCSLLLCLQQDADWFVSG